MFQRLKIIAVVGLFTLVTGCETLHFYQQAVKGQAGLLWKRTATTELLQKDIDPALRDRIELAAEILSYAAGLGLPVDGAYQSYVETGEPFVVWNVFAARPFELALKTSCFPIAGCVTYRGYFSQTDAQRFADKLEADGYETYVGGVAAYSTLGWFNDPLLDTFLFRSDTQLAALLFHELAHRLVYVKDDTRFNESLATTIEYHALEKWLQSRGEPGQFERFIASRQRRDAVIELISQARGQLKSLYSAGMPMEEMEPAKQAVFQRLRDDYVKLRDSWSEGHEFDSWMKGPLNNAKLETVADYNEWVAPLSRRLKETGFEQFRKELSRLAALSSADRQLELERF